MNENPWSILAEFTNPHISENFEQALNAMKTAVEHLHLPEIFLQRLKVALKDAMSSHKLNEESNTSATTIRILSNCTASPTSSWGFFFIEKDHEIELYLYQDGK